MVLPNAPMTKMPKHLMSAVFCVAGLSACAGVARDDQKAAFAGGAPGIAGANSTGLAGAAGRSSAAGASSLDQGGATGVAGDQSSSADATEDAASFACGASTCVAGQICVTRFCGGGPIQCMGETDGGCPMGWHSAVCAGGPFENQLACVPDPCTPPAPECVDAPVGCTGTLSCFCINQSSVCPSGCQSVIGRQVTCAGAE
jgi:hypothetical protein